MYTSRGSYTRCMDNSWLVVHGIASNADTMAIPRLTFSGGKRLAVNLPGHGGTPDQHPDLPLVSRLADYVTQQVKEQLLPKAKPIVAYGHSLGGSVVVEVALRHPELFAALVLEDPALLDPEQQTSWETQGRAGVAHIVDTARNNPEQGKAWLRQLYPILPEELVTAWWESKRDFDLNLLPKATVWPENWRARIAACPNFPCTLLLAGDQPGSLWPATKPLPAGWQSVRISAGDHQVAWRDPQAAEAAISQFIAGGALTTY